MDSITQFVLGAGVGLAVSPVKSRKIAIISGAIAAVPDLDVLINYGDDLHNMINHRSFSHSFFVLSLFSLPLAWLLKRLFTRLRLAFKHWLLLCFLVLNTHVILDSLTIFGTQLFWPLHAPSAMIGSMFIVDIFYTIPLLLTFLVLMKNKTLPRFYGFSLNTIALSLSSGYLVLALVLQQYVGLVNQPSTITAAHNHFVMPTPSNLIIWRSVWIDGYNSYENFYNVLTQKASTWRIISHNKKQFTLDDPSNIKKYNHFSHGFYRLENINNDLVISDLRMGTTQMPIFSFKIGQKQEGYHYRATTPKTIHLMDFSFKGMFGN